MTRADVIIIGGGIIGLATAYQLSRSYPQKQVRLLEKEAALGRHQTGHNSGVLHTGIYYKPDSLKAVNCRDGKLAMQQFCQEQGIEFEICGKVIVAVDSSELPALQQIYDRGCQNGVRCELIDKERLAEIEPFAAGVRAIHVPDAGIIDFGRVCQRLAQLIASTGHEIHTSSRVTKIVRRPNEAVVVTGEGEFAAGLIVNCAGLYCDRVAKLAGGRPPAKIVPFRGEYYKLKPDRFHMCRNLIYPVPDPKFPFLGVHFTRMIDGSVECGPNAVLAFSREGYSMSKINLRDALESLTYGGFIRLAARHWKTGMGEIWRSLSKKSFVRALQRLMPSVTVSDLQPAPAGVRAQAVYPNGQLVDDFLIVESDRVVSINNAPSPAATASLNIARLIVDKISTRF